MGPSSSKTLTLSKKVQQKEDKKVDLEEFKKQTKSNKPMLWHSCKQTDHARFTSKLCPHRKEKKVVQHNDNEKTEAFTIKSSLKTTCTNTTFMKSISNLVEYAIKITYTI
ncbi:hypothetical protein BD408DRAFT_411553, partial [Parasitella parasitica]